MCVCVCVCLPYKFDQAKNAKIICRGRGHDWNPAKSSRHYVTVRDVSASVGTRLLRHLLATAGLGGCFPPCSCVCVCVVFFFLQLKWLTSSVGL